MLTATNGTNGRHIPALKTQRSKGLSAKLMSHYRDGVHLMNYDLLKTAETTLVFYVCVNYKNISLISCANRIWITIKSSGCKLSTCEGLGWKFPRHVFLSTYMGSVAGQIMMTSSNGTIFRVTGLLCWEFNSLRWIPRIKASDAEFWCFLWYLRLNKRLS